MANRHAIYIIVFDPKENCEVDKVKSNSISIIQIQRHTQNYYLIKF